MLFFNKPISSTIITIFIFHIQDHHALERVLQLPSSHFHSCSRTPTPTHTHAHIQKHPPTHTLTHNSHTHTLSFLHTHTEYLAPLSPAHSLSLSNFFLPHVALFLFFGLTCVVAAAAFPWIRNEVDGFF